MKIDYKKRWGKDGTCYTQTIKIDKWLMETFNNWLMSKKIDIDRKFFNNHCYSNYDLKIKSLDYLDYGINYTNLIHLGEFLSLIYDLNNYRGYNFDTKRILDRNTIIEVI